MGSENKKKEFSQSLCALESLISRDLLHTEGESCAHPPPLPLFPLSTKVPARTLTSISGHAILRFRWRHYRESASRDSSYQGSSTNEGFLFRQPHGPNNVRPFFLTPTTNTVGSWGLQPHHIKTRMCIQYFNTLPRNTR